MQQIMACAPTQNEGDDETQHSEFQSLAPVLCHAAHIKLQGSQEHDVVDAYLTENLKRTVAPEKVETMLAHQHACQNQTYYVGYAQPPEQQRCKQDDAQNHEEYPCGVRD